MSTTNKKKRRKEHFKTNKTANEITVCLQTHTSHVTKAAGIKVFYDPKQMRALSQQRIV